MQWGPQIQSLLDFQEESGITPHALLNRPVLDDRLFFFYRVFEELTRERGYDAAGGPMNISRRQFMDYCQLEGWSLEDIRWMWPTIAIFDDVWLDVIQERRNSQNQTKTVQTGA